MANNNDNKFYRVELLATLLRKKKIENYQVNGGKVIPVLDTLRVNDSSRNPDFKARTVISVPLKGFESAPGSYFVRQHPEDIWVRIAKNDAKVTPPGGVALTSMATMPEVNGTPRNEKLSEVRERVRKRWESAYRELPDADGGKSSNAIYELIKRAIKARISSRLSASTKNFWQEADLLKPEFGEVIAKPEPAAAKPAKSEPAVPEPTTPVPEPASAPEPEQQEEIMSSKFFFAEDELKRLTAWVIKNPEEAARALIVAIGEGVIPSPAPAAPTSPAPAAPTTPAPFAPATPAPAAPTTPAPEPKPVAPKPAPTSSKKRNLKDIKADVMSAGHRQLPSKSDPELRKLIQKFVVEHSAGHKNLNQFSDKSYYSRTTFWSRAEELLNDGKQLTDTPAEPTAPAAPVTPATAPKWGDMKAELTSQFKAFNPDLTQSKVNALVKEQVKALGIDLPGNARNAQFWMDAFRAFNANDEVVDIATLAMSGKVAKPAAA